MITNLTTLLKDAKEKNYAIGAFNITNYENITSIIEVAEELNLPTILSFAQTHEENHIAYLDEMGPLMVLKANQAKIPVAVHLDHGIDLNYIERAIKMGFSSIMFDGSSYPFEENIQKTKQATKLARKYNVSIEGEIGKMAGYTLNHSGITENREINTNNYTDVNEAVQFVNETGIDCLAAAFGTVHGEYFSEPNINFQLVKELSNATNVPIVMHGGSGVSTNDYIKVIEAGVRKINYFTYMDKAGGEAIDRKTIHYFHEAVAIGKEAMKQDIKKAMLTFCRKES